MRETARQVVRSPIQERAVRLSADVRRALDRGQCMYKMESVWKWRRAHHLCPAPAEVSVAHGKYIYEAGYHILPYFLADWISTRHLPLARWRTAPTCAVRA